MGKRRDDDEPIKQMLRVVGLIDFVSGWAEEVDGKPISIMTLAHLDELEQPMMLSIKDTKALLVKCLESLAHHGDRFAESLLDKYFHDND